MGNTLTFYLVILRFDFDLRDLDLRSHFLVVGCKEDFPLLTLVTLTFDLLP